MKQYKLSKSPKTYGWSKSQACAKFDEYDIKHIHNCIPDAIFYWYVTAPYEGSGALIAVKDNKWYHKSLSHCSCYGPLENFAQDISEYKWECLDDLIAIGSDDWKKEYEPLVKLAKAKGYK